MSSSSTDVAKAPAAAPYLTTVGAVALILVGLVTAVGGTATLLAAVVAAGLALATALVVVRPAFLLLVFVVVLPWHLLVMVLLFDAGLPADAIRLWSVWKEAAVVAAVVALAGRGLARGRLPRVGVLDVAMAAFLLLNLAYALAAPGPSAEVPLAVRMQGFRDNTMFVLLYLVGRMAPVAVRELRVVLAAALAVGVLGVAAGLAERFLLPLDFFYETLRFDDFMRDHLNLHYYTGIPYNFWTSVGRVRRAVSFYLGSHHFAMASVFLLPLVLGLRAPLRPFPGRLRTPLLGVVVVGLLLPLTRSVMLAALLQVILLGAVRRRPHWVLVGIFGTALALSASVLFLDLRGYFTSVVSAAPGTSVASHLRSWSRTGDLVGESPLGVGFGVVDTAGERSQEAGVAAGVLAGEGEYAFTVTTVGVPGVLLLLAVHSGALLVVWSAWRRGRGTVPGDLAGVVAALLLGLVVVGAFTQVRHVPAFYYPIWWLTGLVVRGGPGVRQGLPGDPSAGGRRRSGDPGGSGPAAPPVLHGHVA